MRRKISYKTRIATLERDRDTLLQFMGALQDGPDYKIVHFFKLLRASSSLREIENYLVREYPSLDDIDKSVMQGLLDRNTDKSLLHEGSPDTAMLSIAKFLN